jgi:Spy/CpxP family protein refolding chaperone
MIKKYRIWVILTLLVVFALGSAAGIFCERYYMHRRPVRASQARPHPPSVDDMFKDLGLSADQQAKIRDLFKKNEQRMEELRTQFHNRLTEIRGLLKNEIDGVLSPEQKQKLEAMIKKHIEESRRQSDRGARTPDRGDPRPPSD